MQAGVSVQLSTESDLLANTLPVLERLSLFGEHLLLSGDSTNVCQKKKKTDLFFRMFAPRASSLSLGNKIPNSEDLHSSSCKTNSNKL